MDSFEDTYKENYSRIYCLARRILNDESVTCDIIQDVFVCYFENQKRGYDFRDIRSWLTRVTLNKCFDYLKHKKIYVELDAAGLLEADLEQEDIGHYGMVIRMAISKLKPLDIKLVLLYIQGYSYKEIAEMTGIKYTSVGKSLSRALDRLKKILKNRL